MSLGTFSSIAQSCPTLCDPMNHSTPGLPVHHQLPEFTQTLVHWSVVPSNHLILCRPLLLLPSIFPSSRVSFPMGWFFQSGGQRIGASASVHDSSSGFNRMPLLSSNNSQTLFPTSLMNQHVNSSGKPSLHTPNNTGLPTELPMFLMRYLCEYLFSVWLLDGLTVPWGHGFCWRGTSGSFK